MKHKIINLWNWALCVVALVGIMSSCGDDTVPEIKEKPLFTLLDSARTNIDFSNDLTYTKDFNVYKYRNFYNGGGVSIGDVNNDGLVDIYLVSNQHTNKLYINKGDLKFEDQTESAGVGGTKAWSTGVTFVDINQDGWSDIYVCNSGDINGDNKENELYINNGDMTFTERAAEYGLNDQGYSTHASFFDYDKDGDLDVYLLNNSYQAIGSFNLRKNERGNHDELGGDKLMENNDGKFTNVSEQAGIYNSVIGFGLGVTVSDFNDDGWLDIFVSNDFFERDYLYLNDQDGTFTEVLEEQIHSISAASMGADAADIDNDGQSDLFVTDMLPYEYERLKTVTTFDDWNRYQYNLKNGYHHQFTRNVLQRNNGNGTFSEVSRYAGVEASDWSWGALFFDMNNDGLKDLFIANGIYKDLTNQDYLQYIANETVIESIVKGDGVNYKELIDIIPSNKVENQAYLNQGKLQFAAKKDIGLWTPSFSNGSAYGDLDNDGDLDLVVNNISMQAFVYENSASVTANYIKIDFGNGCGNAQTLGAKVTVTAGDQQLYYENIPTRGFQSSMDPRMNIGVGDASVVDVEIRWPDGRYTQLSNQPTNQTIKVDPNDASEEIREIELGKEIFSEVAGLDYVKNENRYSDFNRERLIYHMRSNEGAGVSEGDVNGDGKTDLVFPGAKGYATTVFLKANKGYQKANNSIFEKYKESEQTNSLLFDVDQDGDLDLYLASGGVEMSEFSQFLDDQLFLNNGKGQFTLSANQLPQEVSRKSNKAIAHADIDGDGDQDLIVGERIKIGKYGLPGSCHILMNDGQGRFEENTKEVCPQLADIGMTTDAEFTDIDGDEDLDLIIVGEFMDIKLFTNEVGVLKTKEISANVPTNGWWNDITIADIDGDGDDDIIAGNLGRNSRFEASAGRPTKLYVSDFDNNKSPEGVMTYTREDGKDYPYALRHNLIDQMKGLKRKFPDFESFKNADITQIFSKEQLDKANVLVTDQFNTVVLRNEGGYKFTSIELPPEVQFSSMYTSVVADFDHDGDMDIVFGGNQHSVVPEMGIYDASFGVFVEQEDGRFVHDSGGSGLMVRGEIRDFIVTDKELMVVRSNDALQTFKY